MSGNSRVGRRQLATIASGLSTRDRQILQSVSGHRFLTTRQVQIFHFTDHATELAGARACRRVLERLHRLRLLARLERRVGGVRAGSASYVWCVGPVGDRLLQIASGEGARRRVHEPSVAFLDHTLAIADVHLELVGAQRGGALELVRVELEPNCWRTFVGSGGGREVLRPDLYVSTASGEFEDCRFVEVDLGTESLPTILRKCAQYEAYRRSGREQQRLGTFPRVLWLVPSLQRQAKLTGAIQSNRQLLAEMFVVAARNELLDVLAEVSS